jgi:flagellar protein FlbD
LKGRVFVIVVTKLNGKAVVVNAELIKLIESTPDTLITLTSGDHFMVKEDVEEVVERAIEYARRIRSFQVV